MPVTCAKTQMCPKRAEPIHYATKGQQFVQLNKIVNKPKSLQEATLTGLWSTIKNT